ncbi:MAG: hypothetical protein Q4C95_09540 [Planctomycetia bacterium]|nr:hypothetical protein [Planctomycetia bacterium]
MKVKSFGFLLLFSFFLAINSVLLAQNAEQRNQEIAQIEQRAKEIEPFLNPEETILGAPITDRNAWNRFASLPDAQNIIVQAEKLLETPIPEASELLYKEYYRNGNRSNYQTVYNRQQSRLTTLALAEACENQGRFLPALEESIRFICEQPSWLLPAHDRNGEVYDGKTVYSDLASTSVGCKLGIIKNLFKNSLSSDINDLIINNIEKRILLPYEDSIKKTPQPRFWWIRTTNNWNSVCHAGTVGAALSICSSVERRAWFIAASEYFMKKYYFAGFSEDGYCSEGMSYWNYGFGHFIYLATMIRQATHNQVDLFQIPKVIPVTCFAPNLELGNRLFAAFADCPINAKPSDYYVGYMSRMFQLGFKDYEERCQDRNRKTGNLIHSVLFEFDPFFNAASTDLSLSAETTFSLPIRSEFEKAGVWIFRPFQNSSQNRLALALKGGSNNEHHNHNDVGTYSLALLPESISSELKSDTKQQNSQSIKNEPSRFMVVDPGAEIYTARTFGSHRYDGELLNSFGHPVPRINHQLQKQGADAKGIVLEKVFSDQCDKIVLDISSAYDIPELDSIQRTFLYRRILPDLSANQDSDCVLNEWNKQANSLFPSSLRNAEMSSNVLEKASLVICDSIQFKPNQTGILESAIISFEPYKIETQNSNSVILQNDPLTIVVLAVDDQNEKLPLKWIENRVGENDNSVPKKPNRYGFNIDQKVSRARIIFLFILNEKTEQ